MGKIHDNFQNLNLRPHHALIFLMALQMTAWGIIPYLTFDHPWSDTYMHSLFMRDFIASGDFFSFRHPPLPIILTHWLNFGQGALFFPHLFVAQLVVLLTFWLTYLLARELLQNEKAAVASVFFLIAMKFYGHSTIQFNHNFTLMPLWILLILLFYRATLPLTQKKHQAFYWLAFGVTAGIASYAKVTVGILLLTMLVWLLWNKQARRHLTTLSPYIAALIALILIGLNFYFHFYAYGTRSMSYFDIAPHWYRVDTGQLHSLPLIFTLYKLQQKIIIFLVIVAVVTFATFKSRLTPLKIEQHSYQFLLYFCFAPIVLTLAVSLVAGEPMRANWFSTMFGMAGMAVIALTRHYWSETKYVMILLCCVAYIVIYAFLARPLAMGWGHHSEYRLMATELAQKMSETWRKEQNSPLPHVTSLGYDQDIQLTFLLAPDKPHYVSAHCYFLQWCYDNELYSRAIAQEKGTLLVYHLHHLDEIKEMADKGNQSHIFDKKPVSVRLPHPRHEGETIRFGLIVIPPAGKIE